MVNKRVTYMCNVYPHSFKDPDGGIVGDFAGISERQLSEVNCYQYHLPKFDLQNLQSSTAGMP